MKKILVVASSAKNTASNSNQLGKAIVAKLTEKYPSVSVKIRDLAKHPYPHLEEAHLAAFNAPPEKHTEANKQAIRHSDEAIAEIMEADALVVGVPMYNFSIPSSLKAWIDHIVRAGHTFNYTASGPEGLVKGKKLFLAVASGGVYSEGPMKAYDFTEPYLKAVLGFIGLKDVTTFRVEGLAVPGVKETAMEKAIAKIHV